ncbi:hypothetical protein BBP40_011180 [Aspergillus hancockii]|nr:hypothetical protein BBP40_011180 [Aspergillus hancockii]
MFSVIKNASLCVVRLEDVSWVANWDPNTDHPPDKRIKWFTRGWALCELVASKDIVFYARKGQELGRKSNLCPQLARYTGIDEDVLRGTKKLEEVSVAQRLSWASGLKTTEEQDMAYCLMGLFDVQIDPIHGEKFLSAFLRLQIAIIRKHPYDLSILGWRNFGNSRVSNRFLAGSLSHFTDSQHVETTPRAPRTRDDAGYVSTVMVENGRYGTYLKVPVTKLEIHYLLNLGCYTSHPPSDNLAIKVSKDGNKYYRTDVSRLSAAIDKGTSEWIYIDWNGNAFDMTPPSSQPSTSRRIVQTRRSASPRFSHSPGSAGPSAGRGYSGGHGSSSGHRPTGGRRRPDGRGSSSGH